MMESLFSPYNEPGQARGASHEGDQCLWDGLTGEKISTPVNEIVNMPAYSPKEGSDENLEVGEKMGTSGDTEPDSGVDGISPEETYDEPVPPDPFFLGIADVVGFPDIPNDTVGSRYRCLMCSRAFMDNSHLRRHMKSHTGERPYPCSECGRGFGEAKDLAEHMRTHTGERPYKCEVCNKTFAHASNIRRHRRVHTDERPYKCPVCDKTFRNSNNVASHVRTHTGEKPYSCSVCAKAFNLLKSLHTHMRTHTGERPFVCPICGKAFSHSNILSSHKRTHTKEKPFTCILCKKSFTKSNNLNRHMKHIHGGQESADHKEGQEVKKTSKKAISRSLKPSENFSMFLMNVPKESSVNPSSDNTAHQLSPKINLDSRNQTESAPDALSEDCSQASEDVVPRTPSGSRFEGGSDIMDELTCNRDTQISISSESDRQNDPQTGKQTSVVKAEYVEKSFTCGACPESFSDYDLLVTHMKIHPEEKPWSYREKKPFVCAICSQVFRSSNNLAMHMALHTGEKPFQCTICDKTFSHMKSLNTHTKVHTGEGKRYTCTICNRSFPLSNTLKSHMRTHTGEKPFSCVICNRPFSQKTNLVRHVRSHTGEKPYICSICGRRFSQSSNLLTHVKRHKESKGTELLGHDQLGPPEALISGENAMSVENLTDAIKVEPREESSLGADNTDFLYGVDGDVSSMTDEAGDDSDRAEHLLSPIEADT